MKLCCISFPKKTKILWQSENWGMTMALEMGLCLLDQWNHLYPNEGPPAFPMQIQGNTGNRHCTSQDHHILKSFPIKMGNHCFKRVMVKREFTGCYAGIALKWTDTLPASSIIGPGQPHSSKLAPDFTRDREKLTQLLMYLLQQADILEYKYHQEDMRGLRM